MIQLASKNLPTKTKRELSKLQKEVNNQKTFKDKKDKASDLWDSKKNTKGGTQTFEEIEKVLKSMCVSLSLCNYCEHDRANDVEHISPKSFYPNLAFKWENYLLACKQCNTGLKLDKCYTVDKKNVISKVKRGSAPQIKQTYAFINPRIEDPNSFMEINLQTFEFMIRRRITTIDKIKAEKTIEILELNEDDTLIKSRRETESFYMSVIERIIKIQNATSNKEIKEILHNTDGKIDGRKKVVTNKKILTQRLKMIIQTHRHPSVWYAIKKTGSKTDEKWINLFKLFPKAMHW